MTLAYIGAQGRDLPFDLGNDGNQLNRIPFDAIGRYGDLLFSNLSSQPQLGIPLPYPGFGGTVQQALRPYPQYTGITYLNNFRGKTRYNSLQTTLERHFSKGLALVAAYTLSKTEDNYLKQDASGEEWGLAGGGRHFPHFLKLTWIYELPIGPGKADQRGRRARAHRRRLDAHGHPQLPQRRHAERVRQPHQQRRHRLPLPSRRRRRCRPDHLRRVARRSGARHAVPQPGGLCHAAVVGAGRALASGNGAAGAARCRAGRRSTPRTSG